MGRFLFDDFSVISIYYIYFFYFFSLDLDLDLLYISFGMVPDSLNILSYYYNMSGYSSDS